MATQIVAPATQSRSPKKRAVPKVDPRRLAQIFDELSTLALAVEQLCVVRCSTHPDDDPDTIKAIDAAAPHLARYVAWKSTMFASLYGVRIGACDTPRDYFGLTEAEMEVLK